MTRKLLLEAEWSPKNEKEFSNYSNGSGYKAFWEHVCECGEKHEWQARVCDRYNHRNCPMCSGKGPAAQICSCKSLQKLRPDLIKEWDFSRNIMSPDKITLKSDRKVWWICDKSNCEHKHSWEVSVGNRTAKKPSGCPYCSKQKICICNSLARIFPDIASQWHPTKNNLKPEEVSVSCNSKVWWLCNKSNCEHPHEWEAIISDRTGKRRYGCPYCSKHKFCACNSLASLYPTIASQWHPTKNNLKPEEVSVSCNSKVWWLCNKSNCEHPHEWLTSINHRTGKNARNCPFCSGKKICQCDSLANKRPDLVKEWHPIKNKISPEEVSQFSKRKVWWKCLKNPCGHHEWEVNVNNRSRGGNGCPYCSNQKICICNSIVTTHPHLLLEWHPTKNTIDPINISFGSGIKIWWKCKNAKCEHHEWKTSLYHRINKKTDCPFCCARKICSCNNLQAKFPKIASEWNKEKNQILSDQVAPFSNKKVWWQCDKNHEWETPVCNRTNGGNGCPICKENKGEKRVREILTRLGIKFVSQKKISYRECKKLRFDFFLPDHNVAIEFDGIQHFEPVKFFGGEEKLEIQKRNDLYKKLFCKETGTSLLRIHYKDVEEAEELIDFATDVKFHFVLFSTNYHGHF